MIEKKDQQIFLEEKYERISEDKKMIEKERGYLPHFAIIVIAGLLVSFLFLLGSSIVAIVSKNFYFLIASTITIVVLIVVESKITEKLSKIRDELGLYQNDVEFLLFFETYKSYQSYVKSNENKKRFFKVQTIKKTNEIIELVEAWDSGNNPVSGWILETPLSLFKENLKRLLLPNIAKGEKVETELLIIFENLCIFSVKPSLEKLKNINELIGKLPYIKYEKLSSRQKATKFLQSKPTICRLIFASIITIIVFVIILFVGESLGAAFGIGVACFFASVQAFDKLIKIEKNQHERMK